MIEIRIDALSFRTQMRREGEQCTCVIVDTILEGDDILAMRFASKDQFDDYIRSLASTAGYDIKIADT